MCFFLFSFMLIFLYKNEGLADAKPQKGKEVGMLVGYGVAPLSGDDYEIVTYCPYIGFDLRPIVEKGLNVKLPFIMKGIFEPFASYVISPENNAEVGFNLLLKFSFLIYENLYFSIKGGAGIVYTTQHTYREGSQYDFTPQIGASLKYELRNGLSFGFEYRFRHMSNAGSKHPNSGLEMNLYLINFSIPY